MESNKTKLAEWTDIDMRLEFGEELNLIDAFIHEHEPAGECASKFREQLLSLLNHESEEDMTIRNAEVIAKFMQHCKDEGLEIPDTFFESFFNA